MKIFKFLDKNTWDIQYIQEPDIMKFIMERYNIELNTFLRGTIENMVIGQELESEFLQFKLVRTLDQVIFIGIQIHKDIIPNFENLEFACRSQNQLLLEDVRDLLAEQDIQAVMVSDSTDLKHSKIYIHFQQPSFIDQDWWLHVYREVEIK